MRFVIYYKDVLWRQWSYAYAALCLLLSLKIGRRRILLYFLDVAFNFYFLYSLTFIIIIILDFDYFLCFLSDCIPLYLCWSLSMMKVQFDLVKLEMTKSHLKAVSVILGNGGKARLFACFVFGLFHTVKLKCCLPVLKLA